ncbi:MAG: PAS domain-containing sensor histidine kinase [Ignavibacteriaceae bacterium]
MKKNQGIRPVEKNKVKTSIKKAKKGNKPKVKVSVKNKMDDMHKLVHLLEVHQVELEHQNQELRIVQNDLEVSRNRYVYLFDFAPIPYFSLDMNGIIKEVNLNASKMLGVERNKLIGKSLSIYISREDQEIFHSFMKSVLNSNIKQSCELKITNKVKSVFYILLEGLKIDDPLESSQECQLALIDLTERKKVEDSVKKYSEELKILDATKNKFFSIIAHDLRSPFQGLLSASETLSAEMESLKTEEISSYIKIMSESIKNVYHLLNNLLSWSMLQRDLLEIIPEKLNLHKEIDKTVEILKPSAKEKNLEISNDIKENISINADRNILRMIIQNLITNGIKFTNPGGHILITADIRDSFVEISVKDSGVGINSQDIDKLFRIDTSFSSKGTEGENGTGLGLHLCKEFVEKGGGRIWVDSKLGEGSKFTFTLPMAIP